MFLAAFQDELVKHAGVFTKTAGLLAPRRADRLLERMAVTGGLSAGALHGAQAVKAKLSNDPYAAPEGSLLRSAVKGAGGGLLAGLILKALGKAHGH